MANNWQMNPAKWNYSYAGTYLGLGIGAITGGIGGGAALAGTASVSVNALTPFVSVGATYGGPGTYTNGWSYGWETTAGGGAVISKHGYSDEAIKYGIDAQVADIAQTYAAYESGYDYNWDFSAFAAVTPFTAVLAADDASVIGVADDPVAGLLLTGALCKTAYDNRAYIAHGMKRAAASIDRMKTLTQNCRPGYVYHLVATQDNYYLNVRTGTQVYLKKGDTWKIGETINGEARYGKQYLNDRNLNMVQSSPYMTNKYLLRIEEKRQLIEYANKYRTLPPGNKMFK